MLELRTPVGTSAAEPPFVGREDELGQLVGLVTGDGDRARLVRGEPGVGKTALLERTAVLADRRTLRVTGAESEAQLPFSALADLVMPLRRHFVAVPDIQREALEISLALRPGTSGNRLAVCAAVLGVLEAAGDATPLLVLVDDLQWIDPPSAQVITFVARRLHPRGVAMVLAARRLPGEPFDGAGIPVVDLDRLPPAECRRLVAALCHEPSAGAVDRIVDGTGGNPLALVETVRRTPHDALRGSGADVTPRLGPALEAVWSAVLDTLPAATRTALAVVAAAGSPVPSEIAPVLASLGVAPDDLGPAERADLIRWEGDRLVLRHPLVREVVTGPPSSRLRLLRALAEHSSGDRRTWYLAAGARAPDDAVADRLSTAARAASDRAGHDSAARAWARAAQLSGDPARRAQRHLAAGTEYLLTGDFRRVREHAGLALASRCDAGFAADVELVRSRATAWAGDPRRAVDDLVRAAERVASVDPARAATLYAAAMTPAMMAGRIREALGLVREARRVRPAPPGPRGGPSRAVEAHAFALGGDVASALELLEDTAGGERPFEGAWGLQELAVVGQASMFVERLDRARTTLDEVLEVARRDGVASVLGYALAARAEVETWTGRWPAADADATEALRWAEELREVGTVGFALVVLARLDALRGRTASCRRRTERVRAEVGPHGVDCMETYVPAVEGLAALADGDPESAAEHLLQAHRRARESGLEATNTVPYGADLVEALFRAGRVDESHEALSWWDERATSGLTYPVASAARCHGLLAEDLGSAQAWFARARSAHATTPLPFEHARTLLAEAETLRRFRRPGRARPLLRDALATFASSGAKPWAERAEAELAATGVRRETLRRPSGPAWETLTPQEFQVARAVAEGRNNAEVASALFVATKTVEAHLTRIYRKLDVRSRTALARMFPAAGADGGGR